MEYKWPSVSDLIKYPVASQLALFAKSRCEEASESLKQAMLTRAWLYWTREVTRGVTRIAVKLQVKAKQSIDSFKDQTLFFIEFDAAASFVSFVTADSLSVQTVFGLHPDVFTAEGKSQIQSNRMTVQSTDEIEMLFVKLASSPYVHSLLKDMYVQSLADGL